MPRGILIECLEDLEIEIPIVGGKSKTTTTKIDGFLKGIFYIMVEQDNSINIISREHNPYKVSQAIFSRHFKIK